MTPSTKKAPWASKEASDALFFQSIFRSLCYLLFVAALFIRLQYGLFDYPSSPILATGIVLLVATASFIAAARFLNYRGLQHWLLVLAPLMDIAAVTILVNFSGGLQSKLSFLYLIPIFASIFVSFRFALACGAVALAFFIVRSYGVEFGWWQTVEKMGYSPEQLFALNTLILLLLLTISITGVLLYIIFRLRKTRRVLEKYEQVAFTTTAVLNEASEKAARAPRSPEDRETAASLSRFAKRANAALLALEETAIPVEKQVRLLRGVSCNQCREAVGFGQSYYGIPFLHRKSHVSGSHRNDIHCTTCHEAEEREGGSCRLCDIWISPKKETGNERAGRSDSPKNIAIAPLG